jgi:hypothetical protein
MIFLKKITKVIFVTSLVIYLFLSLYKIPLPKENGISETVININPIQTSITDSSYLADFRNQRYKITPLYDYEIYGLVVSEYDSENWLDVMHKNDPAQTKDLCLIWGENLKNGVYRELKYTHGEFTCFYSWRGKLEHEFLASQLSNNHLIPASETLARLIKKSAIGDQVYVKGRLVNYEIFNEEGNLMLSRNTSTIREDNSCEIIFVTDFKVIKKWGGFFKEAKNYSLYSMIVSGGFGLIFLLLI